MTKGKHKKESLSLCGRPFTHKATELTQQRRLQILQKQRLKILRCKKEKLERK
jgi:hypothetical protein